MPLTPTSTNDGIVLTDLSVAIKRTMWMIFNQCLGVHYQLPITNSR
jgi:hypothetical protein